MCLLVSAARAATITGQIQHLRGGHGTCCLALFDGAAGFPRQTARAVRTLQLPVSGPVCAFSFADLPPGTYALAVYHDENNNGQLDTNWVGFPIERFGFSNNARRMMFFPPSFEAARFLLPTDGVRLSIVVR